MKTYWVELNNGIVQKRVAWGALIMALSARIVKRFKLNEEDE